MEEHEAMFAQLEERVQRVLRMLEDLREENRQLRVTIADLKQEGEALRRTIESQSHRIEELLHVETEVAQLRQQKERVRDQLARIIQVLDSAASRQPQEAEAVPEEEAKAVEPSEPQESEELPEEEDLTIDAREVLSPDEVEQLDRATAEASESIQELLEPEAEVVETSVSEDLPEAEPSVEEAIVETVESVAEVLEPEAVSEEVEQEVQDLERVDLDRDTDEVPQVEEPELAGPIEVDVPGRQVSLTPEEEAALALIYRYGELDEERLEELMAEQGFANVRPKQLTDQIIEKGMQMDQDLIQIRFERGRFYYRKHPNAPSDHVTR